MDINVVYHKTNRVYYPFTHSIVIEHFQTPYRDDGSVDIDKINEMYNMHKQIIANAEIVYHQLNGHRYSHNIFLFRNKEEALVFRLMIS